MVERVHVTHHLEFNFNFSNFLSSPNKAHFKYFGIIGTYCASEDPKEGNKLKLLRYNKSWSSLVRGDEGSYQPNSQTNLVMVLYLSVLFCNFINAAAYHLGRYEDLNLLLRKSSMNILSL